MEETGNDSAIKNMIGKILILRGAGHVTWKVTIVRSFILPETVVPFVFFRLFPPNVQLTHGGATASLSRRETSITSTSRRISDQL